MPTRIAINGFGRIGRAVFKVAQDNDDIEIVALNDLTDNETLAHLLQYDSVYGIYGEKISADAESITVGDETYTVLSEKDPEKLPWKDMEVDIVIESTGIFRTEEGARKHLAAGAKRVIISAPAKGGNISTYVMGVNNDELGDDEVVSNASCTTNCIAPPARVLHTAFGIEKALMTTIHAYTADQNIVDGPHKDLRRARAAAINIVPTTTGAAKATTKTIPDLTDKFDGMAVRVPTPVGSLADFSIVMKKDVTEEEVNEALTTAAAEKRYKGVMMVTNDPIVSSDIVGNPHASIVDLGLTKVVDGNLVKVVSWYDNEWGYSHSLVRLALQIGGQM